MTVELEAVERDLRERGLPFALATVVWRRSPSSAKVGARAVVTAATASGSSPLRLATAAAVAATNAGSLRLPRYGTGAR